MPANKNTTEDELLPTGHAARILELSPEMVRKLFKNGRLPAMRTVTGEHLFKRRDVEQLRRERDAAKKQRASG